MGGGSLPVASAEAAATPEIAAEEAAENSLFENPSQLNNDDLDAVGQAASGEGVSVGDSGSGGVVSTEASESERSGEISIPAATQRVNEDVALTSRTVAQAESTRSFFLAQTLESTRTVPIVSANLPLDTGTSDAVVENDETSQEEGTEEDSDDDDDGDPAPVDPSFSLDADDPEVAADSNGIASASTVIGSFTSNGITYAVEPGGETVAVVAVDGSKLAADLIDAQTIVLPAAAFADGSDLYSVTRLADYALAGSAGITTVTIPASIAAIGEDAFAGSDTLQYAVVSPDNPNYSMYDGVLYNADGTSLLLIPEGRAGVVRVLSQTESVDESVFSHCAVETVLVGADRPYLTSEDDVYNKNDEPVEVIALDLDDEEELAVYPQPYTADYDELVAALGGDSSQDAAVFSDESMPVAIESRVAEYAISDTDRATELYQRLLAKYENDRFLDDTTTVQGLADGAYEKLQSYKTPQLVSGAVNNGIFWSFTEGGPLDGQDEDGVLTLTIWSEGGAICPFLYSGVANSAGGTANFTTAYWGPCRPYVERVVMLDAGESEWPRKLGHTAAAVSSDVRTNYGMANWFSNMIRLVDPTEVYLAPRVLGSINYSDATYFGIDFTSCFQNCQSLTWIPKSCVSLRSYVYGSGTVSLNYWVYNLMFANCRNVLWLEEGSQFVYPNTGTKRSIRLHQTFLDCVSLTSLPNGFTLPSSPNYVYGTSYIFERCTSLVILPTSLNLYSIVTKDGHENALSNSTVTDTAFPLNGYPCFTQDSSDDPDTKLTTFYKATDLSALHYSRGDAYSYWKTQYGRRLILAKPNQAEFFVPCRELHPWSLISWDAWRPDTLPSSMAESGYTEAQRTVVERDGLKYVNEPPAPYSTREGYVFDGWYADPAYITPFDFSQPVGDYPTLWAKFTPLYDVSFDTNGGEFIDGQSRDQERVEPAEEVLMPAASEVSHPGYEFDGWMNAATGDIYEAGQPYTHMVSNQGVVRIKARWKYKIMLDGNVRDFMNSAGDEVTATIDPTFPNLKHDENGVTYLDAYYGEPIQLPTVSREGYEDTRAWGVQCGTNDNAGRAYYILPLAEVDGSFWSVKSAADKTKAAPTESALIANGGSAPAPTFEPKPSGCTVTLYADWSGDVEGLGDSLGGTRKTYKVKLISQYEYTDIDGNKVVYKATDGTPATLENVTYNSPIAVPTAMTAPIYKTDGSTYNTLVFSGFWSEPNGPAPEVRDVSDEDADADAAATYAGSVMIKLGTGSDADKLVGSQPFRKVTTDSDGYVLLYALWTFPFSDVVFHMNEDALESPLADFADATKDASKLFCKTAGTPLKFTVETKSSTPALVQDDGAATADGFTVAQLTSAATARTGYTFNGWWTHPYLETGASSVQYYDAQNKIVHENWDPYTNTVLYAHWKYTITFDRGSDDTTWETWHKGTTMPAGLTTDTGNNKYLSDTYGNRYYYVDYDEGGKGLQLASITAIAGAPVKLPYATGRPGYDDTCAWSQTTKSDTVSGLTGTCVPTDAEGFTLASSAADALRAKPAVTPVDGAVLLYPYWGDSAKKVSIVLVNSYGDYADGSFVSTPVETVLKDSEGNDVKAVYDRAFNGCTDVKVAAPQLNGYTFTGYFNANASNPQRFLAPAAAAAEGGRLQAAPTAEVWRELADDGTVKLYAHYELDAYRVEFDLSVPGDDATSSADATKTPGTQDVKDYDHGTDVLKTATWAWGDTMGSKSFPVASAAENEGAFFRNGYDFDGWYYLNESGQPVMVSNADGEGTSITWKPSYAWQAAHKADDPAIKLYAAWTPKTYALRFNPNYKGEELSQNWIPNAAAKASWPNGTLMEQSGGVWYYKVRYEDPITPFYASGAAADPAFKAYTFDYWGTNDNGTAASSAHKLTLNDAKATTFMPKYPLSTKDATSNAEAPRTIDFYGAWITPGNVSVTFFAGDHGTFSGTDPNKYTIASVGYEWDATLDENSALWNYIHPQNEQPGYKFVGYVWADADGNYVDADGNSLGSPYASDGELRSDVKTVARLHELTRNTYLIAVYSRNAFEVNLSYPADATLRTADTDGAVRNGWWVNDNEYTTRYAFNVESGTFRLPDDVAYAGKNFTGWYRVKTVDGTEVVNESKAYTTIDPLVVATGNPEDRNQKFVAKFTEKVYKVSFVPDHPNGDAIQQISTVYLDYDGKVLGGTLADTGEAVVRQLFGTMPGAPYPYVKTTDNNHGAADAAAAGDHYHSYAFGLWKIGVEDPSSLETKAASAVVTADDWHRWFDTAGFVTAIDPSTLESGSADAKAGITDEMRIFGVWNEAYNAVVPLYVNMVVDTETAKVAIPERDYGIFSMNGKLEVAALRYESVEDASGNVFANTANDPVYLSVFVGRTAAPDMGQPTIDAATGIVSGDYGTGGDRTGLLQLDLTGKARTVYKGELASYGFRAFDGSPLRIHYALDLDGIHKSTLAAMRLPDAATAQLDEQGWTQGVPVAKLHYTVQRVLTSS